MSPTYRLLREAFDNWLADRAPTLGAAIAFYSVLSVAPLLVIAVAVAALAFGRQTAQGQILDELRSLLGQEGAAAIGEMLAHAQQPGQGIVAAGLGLVTLLVGASGVFGELQTAMNVIWKVQPTPQSGIADFIRQRFLSFAMVLGTGFLLLVSLVLSAVVAGFGKYLSGLLPALVPLLQFTSTLVTLIVATCLFAMMFKLLPDTFIAWRDVWVGALVTALLFTVGKTLIALYLGKSGLASAYGAAGSLVVLIVWTYYSAQMLLFGAELTHVISVRHRAQRSTGVGTSGLMAARAGG